MKIILMLLYVYNWSHTETSQDFVFVFNLNDAKQFLLDRYKPQDKWVVDRINTDHNWDVIEIIEGYVKTI